MEKRGLTDHWIQHPQADVWLSAAAGIVFMLGIRFLFENDFAPFDVASVLAGVAGTVLGMFGIVFGLLGSEGGRRVQAIVKEHAETVNRNWQSVLVLPALALGASLFVVMVASRWICLSTLLLGFSAAAVALSGLRMAWFVWMTFGINQAEKQEVQAEIDPDF